MHSGLIRLIRVGELPLHLRRNRQPLGERAEPLEKFGPFLWRDRESDAQPARIGDQIGSNQKDQIPHRAQSPFKPARRKHGFPKPHQQIVEDAARAEGRIGRIEGLQTEGVQTQSLFIIF